MPGGTVPRLVPYAPAVIWAALVLIVGGRSDVPTVKTDLPLDKAAHFVAYGILGALVTVGWLRTGRPRKLLWVLLLAILLGGIDELHQRVVANRYSDLTDWFADAIGVIVGATLVRRFKKDSSNVV